MCISCVYIYTYYIYTIIYILYIYSRHRIRRKRPRCLFQWWCSASSSKTWRWWRYQSGSRWCWWHCTCLRAPCGHRCASADMGHGTPHETWGYDGDMIGICLGYDSNLGCYGISDNYCGILIVGVVSENHGKRKQHGLTLHFPDFEN